MDFQLKWILVVRGVIVVRGARLPVVEIRWVVGIGEIPVKADGFLH